MANKSATRSKHPDPQPKPQYRSRFSPPGSNWEALKKKIAKDTPTHPSKRRRISSVNPRSMDSIDTKGKARQVEVDSSGSASGIAAETAGKTGSPAPTSLPWFAEDLSPEDLALVRNLNVQVGPNAHPQWNGWDAARGTDAEEARKKQIILGGHWDGPDHAAKQEPGTYIAIDCEMVGVGVKGSESVLARVSIVNWHGCTLLDRFVKPQEKVTDYRTFVSGIRAKDLVNAPTFDVVQKEVADLISGRVLVGHAIQNDLKAMLLDHPRRMIRDTATFQPLRDMAQTKFPSLRKLAKLVLRIDIQQQGQEHSSVEDARATMAIFRTQKDAWEKQLREEQAGHVRRLAKKAAKLGKDTEDSGAARDAVAPSTDESRAQPRTSAAASASSSTDAPAKRKTNQALPGWWKNGDW